MISMNWVKDYVNLDGEDLKELAEQVNVTYEYLDNKSDLYRDYITKENFNDNFEISGDITEIDEKSIPSFEICLAGFPCQAFSIAGKKQGFDDDYKGKCRGTLFFDVLRICAFHRPKVIFCENVKGLFFYFKNNYLSPLIQEKNYLSLFNM